MKPGSKVATIALTLALAMLPGARARAGETEDLRRQVEAQNELIRQQSEALQQMGDRVRALEDERRAAPVGEPAPVSSAPPAEAIARHRAGSGFRAAENDWGSLDIRFYTSIRYLNQRLMESTTTDSFGVERNPKRRNDIQHQKVLIYFTGWALDPKLSYMLYAWTSNPSQGLGAQVVLAGNLQYRFAEWLRAGAGTNGLPGVRSTEGNFPFWLPVDNRTIAEEFFRPSYTFGVWANGEFLDAFDYMVMLGNNISQLGVDANRLDADFDTVSAVLGWEPLGPYGKGFGDFEEHETLAARFAAHFSFSSEDVQNQPDTDDGFQNVTLRLSDGNPIFTPDLFGDGIQIRNANYQMASVDAGLKYKGFSLEGGYYYRLLNEFSGRQMDELGIDDLEDHGFQLFASAMVLPERLQAYVAGSKVFGDYGDPWDARIGINWFPFRTKTLRWNNEVLYVDDSPVGGTSLPYPVYGEGPILYSTIEFFF